MTFFCHDYTDICWGHPTQPDSISVLEQSPSPSSYELVNWNIGSSHDHLVRALKGNNRELVASAFLDEPILGGIPTADIGPWSILLYPIYSNMANNSDIAAFIVAEMAWGRFLSDLSVVPDEMVVEVTNTCNQSIAYM